MPQWTQLPSVLHSLLATTYCKTFTVGLEPFAWFGSGCLSLACSASAAVACWAQRGWMFVTSFPRSCCCLLIRRVPSFSSCSFLPSADFGLICSLSKQNLNLWDTSLSRDFWMSHMWPEKAQMCLFINVYFSVVNVATLCFPAYNCSFLLSIICVFLIQNNLNLFLLQDGIG